MGRGRKKQYRDQKRREGGTWSKVGISGVFTPAIIELVAKSEGVAQSDVLDREANKDPRVDLRARERAARTAKERGAGRAVKPGRVGDGGRNERGMSGGYSKNRRPSLVWGAEELAEVPRNVAEGGNFQYRYGGRLRLNHQGDSLIAPKGGVWDPHDMAAGLKKVEPAITMPWYEECEMFDPRS